MQKFELWGFRSGSVRPNILPSLGCLLHWRNSGSLYWTDLGMLATMLKGGGWGYRGGVGYRERGECNLSGIKEYIASALSTVTDILP